MASIYECVGESLGSIMWEGSLALVYFILSQEHFSSKAGSLQILELGAGTGVAGLLLASTDVQASITLTDLPLLVPLMQKNIAANSRSVCAQALSWGTEESKNLSGSFDVILAADVVYSAELIEPLLHTLREVALANTLVVIAYRYRGPQEERFFTLAAEDFIIEKVALEQDWNQGLSIQRVVEEEEAAREAAFERSLANFRGATRQPTDSRRLRSCNFAPHPQPLCIFTMKKRCRENQ